MIHVQNLTKKFDTIVAVDNVSFSVAKGEIFAFLGPNGAGKSTTIKMLTTLLHPSGGTITLDGHDPVHHPDGGVKVSGTFIPHKTQRRIFFLISFIANFLGILAIGWAAKSVN